MEKGKTKIPLNDFLLDKVSGGNDMGEGYFTCTHCGSSDYDKMQFIGMVDGRYYLHCDRCSQYFYADI